MIAIGFRTKLVAVLSSFAIALTLGAGSLETQEAFAHHDTSTHHSSTTVSKPGKCKIASLSRASKSCTVKWKKVSGATSYEIKCTPKSSGYKTIHKKVGNISKTKVSGLKSSVSYNVQVRACKTVNGTKHCGSWSSKCTAKAKSSTSHHSASHSYTVYITNTGSKFHASGCRSLSRSKIQINRSSAIKQGYTPCGICHP